MLDRCYRRRISGIPRSNLKYGDKNSAESARLLVATTQCLNSSFCPQNNPNNQRFEARTTKKVSHCHPERPL